MGRTYPSLALTMGSGIYKSYHSYMKPGNVFMPSLPVNSLLSLLPKGEHGGLGRGGPWPLGCENRTQMEFSGPSVLTFPHCHPHK